MEYNLTAKYRQIIGAYYFETVQIHECNSPSDIISVLYWYYPSQKLTFKFKKYELK